MADQTRTRQDVFGGVPVNFVDNGDGTFSEQVSMAGGGGGGGDASEATLATRLSEADFDTKTGALTETAPASDTASSGLNGRLQRIAQRLTSLIGGLGAAADSSATTDTGTFSLISLFKRLLQKHQAVVVWTNFTRPNNTDVYSAGEAVTDNAVAGSATNLTFTNVAAENGGGGIITWARLVSTNNAAAPATFVLNLFTVAPATSGDNAAAAFTDAEMQGGNWQGSIVFNLTRAPNPAAGASGNRTYRAENIGLVFKTGAATRNLIGVLQVDSAYTPIANERFDIGLGIVQL